jgi:hypothetical protein
MSEPQPTLNQLKEVEFYSANLNAWFSTRFEHDRSLLALSAGAVGLLITLISTIGVGSIEILILYILALACFVICLSTLIWIFKRNSKHLEDVVKASAIDDPLLNVLDNTAVASFMCGVMLSSIIGISTAIHSYIEKAQKMTDKTEQQGHTVAQDSSSGISSIRPTGELSTSSVNGISSMRPADPQPKENQNQGNDKK